MRGIVRLCCCLLLLAACATVDPLPSWNEGAAKQSILDFVAAATDPEVPTFVPAAQRFATFDNDGTLWVEKPMYPQVLFAFDRVRELAPQHPEWKTTQPYKAILENDQEEIGKQLHGKLTELIEATHTGMTQQEFRVLAREWYGRTRHPRYGRPYDEVIYQPMLELLDYLRAHGFKTYIMTAGGRDFVRAISLSSYGIPPEQVIGSSFRTEYELRGGEAVVLRKKGGFNFADKGGKPAAISLHIGRRPAGAAGNSDGDQQMLQYAAGGKRARLMLLVHHDDAEREYAYDRGSVIGGLDKALDEARERKWTVVSMKRDWNRVFPFDPVAAPPVR